MTTSIILFGPESSGTKLIERGLVEVGFQGVEWYVTEKEVYLPKGPVVWRRSWPHGGVWPDTKLMVDRLKARGDEVIVITTSRDWWCSSISHTDHNHVETQQQAVANLTRVYTSLYKSLVEVNVPFTLVPYESLLQNGWIVLKKALSLIGYELKSLPTEEIVDNNTKYYKAKK